MNKKAFTLIELLSVIIILAIILVVAVPKILKVIEDTRISSFISDQKMLVKAAEVYAISNVDILPVNVGDTSQVKLGDLQSNKLISNIKSKNGSNNCTGYVLITKLDDNKYDYTPHLNCISNITSLEEDKLVAHYKFDDFQEPTTNLLIDNGIINWTVANLVATVTRTTVTANDRYILTSGSTAGTIRFNIPLSKLTNGFTYNLSYKYKINSGTVFNMSDWCDTTVGNKVDIDYGSYKYSSGNGTKATYDTSYRFMDLNISANSEVEIWDVQLEQKSYATPFIGGVRTAIVKDYSSNNNHATLQDSTTPKWTESSKVGTGAYEFNTNSQIDLPLTMNNTNYGMPDAQYTFSMWINLKKHNTIGTGLILGMAVFNGFGIGVSSDGASYTRLSTYFRNSVSTYSTPYVSIDLNKWYQVTSVLDKSLLTVKFYLDGVLIHERSVTSDGFSNENQPFAINRLNQPSGSGPWVNIDGRIDDVRIYNRVLNADEIKSNYTVENYNSR